MKLFEDFQLKFEQFCANDIKKGDDHKAPPPPH